MEDTCSKLVEYRKINKEWFNFFINIVNNIQL